MNLSRPTNFGFLGFTLGISYTLVSITPETLAGCLGEYSGGMCGLVTSILNIHVLWFLNPFFEQVNASITLFVISLLLANGIVFGFINYFLAIKGYSTRIIIMLNAAFSVVVLLPFMYVLFTEL